MRSVSEQIDAISHRIHTLLDAQHLSLPSHRAETDLINAAAQQAVTGGKNLRGLLCIAGWHAITGHDAALDDPIVGVAAALEIFHTAALVHDDIIDHSDTRRGYPAAHRFFEQHHRNENWARSPEEFGVASALLLGDLLLGMSDDLLEQSIIDHPNENPTRAEYACMRRDVTVGQFLDVSEESAWVIADNDTHLERALVIADYKSGRYSVQQPLLIGAVLAGASNAQRETLSAFGRPIGMAFQLRDDLLGVFGSEKQTGKPTGDDLREGKRTALVALTRKRLSASNRARFDELFGQAELTATEVEELKTLMSTCGAVADVESLITEHAAAADQALQNGSLTPPAREYLQHLAHRAVNRTT